MVHTAARDGIVYNVDKTSFGSLSDINSLGTETITAYSVRNGTTLWKYTVPVIDRQTVTLNESNIDMIFSGENGAASALKPAGDYSSLYPTTTVGSALRRRAAHAGRLARDQHSPGHGRGVRQLQEHDLRGSDRARPLEGDVLERHLRARQRRPAALAKAAEHARDVHGGQQQHTLLQHRRREDLRHVGQLGGRRHRPPGFAGIILQVLRLRHGVAGPGPAGQERQPQHGAVVHRREPGRDRGGHRAGHAPERGHGPLSPAHPGDQPQDRGAQGRQVPALLHQLQLLHAWRSAPSCRS